MRFKNQPPFESPSLVRWACEQLKCLDRLGRYVRNLFFSLPEDRLEIDQISKESIAFQYLSRYTYAIDRVNAGANQDSTELMESSGCDKIWQVWFQGYDNAPQIVKSCLDSIEEKIPEKRRILISEDTLEHYVELPGYIYDKRNQGCIPQAHFSDIVRTFLLAEHGGTWMDATVYLTGRPSELFFRLPLFYFSRTPPNLMGYGHIVGSSWYLRAAKSSWPIVCVRELLMEYWMHESECRHYYFFHLMFAMVMDYAKDFGRVRDTVPFFSNVPPHVLQMELFNTFDSERFDCIKQMSPIHKLTYYNENGLLTAKPNTFYDYIVNA